MWMGGGIGIGIHEAWPKKEFTPCTTNTNKHWLNANLLSRLGVGFQHLIDTNTPSLPFRKGFRTCIGSQHISRTLSRQLRISDTANVVLNF